MDSPRRFAGLPRASGRPLPPVLALASIAPALLAAAAIGCGQPARVPVTGVVTLDDKPVEGAAVMFLPKDGGPAATGATDSEGRFQLSTLNSEGAAPGFYRVSVAKVSYQGAPASKEGVEDVSATKTHEADDAKDKPQLQVTHELPQRYGDPEKSELTASVGAGGGDFKFSLKSEVPEKK